MNAKLQSALVEIALRTPLKEYLGYRYQHMFSPAQLCFLLSCLDATNALAGPIIEVGCAAGMTTVWLNKHLDTLPGARRYVAIDTFSGFTTRDIQHEVSMRGKAPHEAALREFFGINRKSWVEKNLRRNGINRVTLIEADAASVDYSAYSGISFSLIDADLYLPVKSALERLYPQMAKGGIIVVDDCAGPNLWDGALQAYQEFVEANHLPVDIVHGKLGIIRVYVP